MKKTTDLFSGKAQIYDRFRPQYPAVLLDYLRDRLSLTQGSCVADVGAGTGIFTRLLLEKGLQVIAVEPNADMRRTMEGSLSRYPGFSCCPGCAEDTGLPCGSVEVVVAAQAFHWFDREGFRAECHRILRSRGQVFLVWNNRDEASPLVRDNAEICRRFCPGFKGFSGGARNEEGAIESFFELAGCECRLFPNDLEFDREGFIGRNLSSSYAPVYGTREYTGFVEALESLFEKYSTGGTLTLQNVARSYLGQV